MRRVCSAIAIVTALGTTNAQAEPEQPGEGAEKAADKPAAEKSESKVEDTLVVTGKRPGRTQFNTPLGTSVIDKQRMDELQPEQTAEALRRLPGVWVQRTGAGGGAPIIRGFMGNRVLYLFDGIRRNTASIFGGPNGFLNNTDPMATRRVEVIRGPGSVLYGSDAIGGVINVITAHPLDFAEEGDTRYEGGVRSWYSTVSSTKAAGFEVGLVTPDILANVGASYMDIGNVKQGGGDELDPTSSNYRAVDAQLAYRINKKDSIELLTQYFDRPEGTRFDKPSARRESKRQMYTMRYRGKRKGPFSEVFAEAYYHSQLQNDTDTKKPEKARNSDETTFGGEARATLRTGNFSFTSGVHFHRDTLKREKPVAGEVDPEVTWDNPAAYVLGEYFASDRLTLQASTRYDYFLLKSKAPPTGAGIPQGLEATDLAIERSNQAFTGGLGAIFNVTNHLNWVSYAGTAFRAPGKSDYLRVGEFTFGYGVPPGGDLKPERAYTVETGLRSNYRRVEGSLNFFYTKIQDVMVSNPTTFNGSKYLDWDKDGRTGEAEDNDGDDQVAADEEVYAKQNEDSATAYGLEVAVRGYVLNTLSVYGNGTWMKGEQGPDNDPLDRAIPLNGTLGLRWQDKRQGQRFWAEIEATGAADLDRLNPNRAEKDPAYKVDPQDKKSASILNSDGAIDGFVTYNFRAGARLIEHVNVTLNLENLADSKYRVKDSRLNAPGFNARLGLAVNY